MIVMIIIIKGKSVAMVTILFIDTKFNTNKALVFTAFSQWAKWVNTTCDNKAVTLTTSPI